MNGKRVLEICAGNLESALIAQQAGADRVELCQALELGGVTPSPGMLLLSKRQLQLPIHVLIRPRSSNFVYSASELEVMKEDIRFCKSLGINGIVFGILTTDNQIDKINCRILCDLAHPMSLTFHRGFDECWDPFQALEDIIELGFNRILTSGGKTDASENTAILRNLIIQADNRIVIMPGGGIRPDNVEKILLNTGANEVHSSAIDYKKGKRTLADPTFVETLKGFM